MAHEPDETRTCSACGTTTTAPAGGLPEGWSTETTERGVMFQCRNCVRSNIRAIEGKLPQEWWE